MKFNIKAVTLFSVAFVAAVLMMNTSGAERTSAQSTSTTCSQNAETISLSVDNQFLVIAPVDETWGITSIGPIATAIPTGTYDLDYVSFDNHADSPEDNDPRQTQEQWYIEGYNGDNLIFTSNVTDDVPTDKDYISGVLNTGLQIGTDVDNVIIRHKLNVDVVGTLPESVYPICVSFNLAEVTPVICEEDSAQGRKTQECVKEPKDEEDNTDPGVLGDSTTIDPTPTNTSAAVLGDSTTGETLANTGVASVFTTVSGLAIVMATVILARIKIRG